MDIVSDLMTDEVITINPGTDLSVAWNLFEDRAIRHLPVVDEFGCLVGLISHRDLARRALGNVDGVPVQQQRAILAAQMAEEIMEQSPESTTPDEPLIEAAERMIENKFGCLPVVEGDVVVGILAESDFVRWYVQQADGRR